jgi:hypothetical protein
MVWLNSLALTLPPSNYSKSPPHHSTGAHALVGGFGDFDEFGKETETPLALMKWSLRERRGSLSLVPFSQSLVLKEVDHIPAPVIDLGLAGHKRILSILRTQGTGWEQKWGLGSVKRGPSGAATHCHDVRWV